MAKDDVNVSAPRSMTYKLVTVFQIGCNQRGACGRCQNTGIDLCLMPGGRYMSIGVTVFYYKYMYIYRQF